ncbi:uncharacterized protein LOC128267239 [Anopheles cruzii]|uniref:uncharacterized protein LOC128267239 n=1 Tax=Anopheles cruzii TaxID=68878 RepID=UPI0022EC7C8D|nr:uncharacterized protein LOC128267239 [Anopheles cruzii]
MRQRICQRPRTVVIVVIVLLGACSTMVQSIYDPRASPNRAQFLVMPEMHGAYSQVHHHKAHDPVPLYVPASHYQYAQPQTQPQSLLQPSQIQHGPSAPLYQPGVPLAAFPTYAQGSQPYQASPVATGPVAPRANFAEDGPEKRLIGETTVRKPVHSLLKDFNGRECPADLTGHFVYVMDCRQFLNCWKGRGTIQNCAPGTLFNPDTRQCDHPSKVNCLPVPSLNSIGEQDRQHPARTPPSNPKLAAYVDPNQAANIGQQQAALECPRGVVGLRPHPTDCRKFLQCNDGARFVQDCAPGTAFNPLMLICDYIHNVDCDKRDNIVIDYNQRPLVSVPLAPYPTPARNRPPQQVPAASNVAPAVSRPQVVNPVAPQEAIHPDVEEIDVPTAPSPSVDEQDADYGFDFDLRSNFDDSEEDHRQPKASRTDTQTAPKQPDPVYPVYVRPPTKIPHALHRQPPLASSTTPRTGSAQAAVGSENINIQQHLEALKLMLTPYQKEHQQKVALNVTKLSTMMTTTTTEAPPVVQVVGLPVTDQTPPKNQSPSANYFAVPPTPSEVNDLLYGSSQTVPLAAWPLPPPYITDQPTTPESVVSPIQRRPTSSTTMKPQPTIRSRFGDNRPNPWRPMIMPHATTTTTTTTTTPRDPCYGKFDCGNGICVEEAEVCDGRDTCGNRADETVCDHIGYELKLSKKMQGSVEVRVYDRWGYVCDDSFDISAANVVCREMGYAGGAIEVKPHSYFPPNATYGGEPFFMMDGVRCQGNESSLRECEFAGWGISNCNAEEVVGVVCRTPVMACPADYWLCKTSEECIPVGFQCDNVNDCADGSDEAPEYCKAPLKMRLMGGPNDREGRVEINYHGTWGTVCDDDFGVHEARVICRQLGFNGTAEVRKSVYPPGIGQIWLDQVACNGTEKSIDDCVHFEWGGHNCDHTEDVGVRCGVYVPTKARSARLRNTRPNPRFDFEERSRKIHPDACGQVMVDPALRKPTYGERVVHGSQTVYGHHPWQASLRVKTFHWCGAVLITRYHVLTAAHCLAWYSKNAYRVRIGDYHTAAHDSAEKDIFIENTYIHEEFRNGGHHMSNDIAVVVLKTPVRFNEYVQPICLPPQDAPYQPGLNCTISGWGATVAGSKDSSYDLRAGTVPLLPHEVCRRPEVYGDALIDGMFCAGTLESGVDACDGDSGGPLVCPNDNGLYTLTGIVSWGKHCGFANKPGVYLNVAFYRDWIEEKLKQSLHQHGV